MRVVSLLVLVTMGALLVAAEEVVDARWRAGPVVLTERVERLAAAGEVDAGAAVLQELLRRPKVAATGLDDRARMALARGYVEQGQTEAALRLIEAISWADKDPAVAADIVGLRLAVRWQGLFDATGQLRSGLLPAMDVVDAPQGRAAGDWLDRRRHVAAFDDLLVQGLAMVEAEGSAVSMPAAPPWIRLARFAHGRLDPGLARKPFVGIAPAAQEAAWLAALCRLQLEEHAIDRAMQAAEALWSRAPEEPVAQHCFTDLRRWQLRRRAVAERLLLWDYPQHDRRIDQLAQRYRRAAAVAADTVAAEEDLQRWVQIGELSAALAETGAEAVELVDVQELVAELDGVTEQISVDGQRNWRLVDHYDGLQLIPERVDVAAGTPVELRLQSILRGPHRLQVFRLPDRDAWDALVEGPRRSLLPATPVYQRTVDFAELDSLGRPETWPVELPVLPEGFYIATLSARGAPVVVLCGFTVTDPDLHLIAGRDGVLAWVVSRKTAQAKPAEPIALRCELIREPQQAAGEVWADASPAWRAGFRSAYLDKEEDALLAEHQRDEHAAGRAAGRAAAQADPPQVIEEHVDSDADGLVHLRLPAAWAERGYRVTARIDRPAVVVARSAAWGRTAQWTAKTIAWADRPLVRPGETVGWRALLRQHDGDRFRLPAIGAVDCRLLADTVVLWQGRLPVGPDGSLHGECLVPPATANASLKLQLGEPATTIPLATIAPRPRPELSMHCEGVAAGTPVRAGEVAPVVLTLRDAGGTAIEGLPVEATLRCLVDGTEHAVEQPAPATSDLAGRVHYRIATLPETAGHWRLSLRCVYDGRAYRVEHSWRTATFPFRLETELLQRSYTVGAILRLGLRLPAGARVRVALASDGQVLDEPTIIVGGPEGAWQYWSQVLDQRHRQADALVLRSPTLDGAPAERRLPIAVAARPASAADGFGLDLLQDRLDPGDDLDCVLRHDRPGSDVLLIAGARAIIAAERQRMTGPVRRSRVRVDATWTPNCHLQAICYRDGFFQSSEPQEVQVRPVQRLLRVRLDLPEAELRPGSAVPVTVQVRSWQGTPVAGAHLSLGAVDAAIADLAVDPTPDLWKFFHDYRRAWWLVSGEREQLAAPAAQLWRSVIRRWRNQSSEAFGHRSGGGRRHAVGRYGGSQASESGLLITPDRPSRICWLGDLVTDAEGRATVTVTLPPVAGDWRLTARANDAAAAVLVGEVEAVIASRRLVQADLHGPELARPGAELPCRLELVNRSDARQTVSWQLGDATPSQLVLLPQSRRRIMLPVSVHEPAGPIVERGGLLGRIAELAVTISLGEEEQVVRHSLLVLHPGLPEEQEVIARVDDSGRLPLGRWVPPGAAVQVVIRAWGDVGARWRDWSQNSVLPAVRALGWLRASPGAERRAALAAVWPELGEEVVDDLVRQVAAHRGATGVRQQGRGDAYGAWLLARGRALGMALPEPPRRGVGPWRDWRLASVLSICAGRLAGWPEALAPWADLRASLDGLNDPDAEQAVVLALVGDSARLLGDAALAEACFSRLATAPWQPLTAVLTGLAVAERPAAERVPVQLLGVDGATPFDDGASAASSGIAGADSALAAEAGTLLRCRLRWQHPLPPQEPAPIALHWWQRQGDHFFTVPAGVALWPGRETLMELRPTAAARGRAVHCSLPIDGPWRLQEEGGVVALHHGIERRWDPAALAVDAGSDAVGLRRRLLDLLPRWPVVQEQRRRPVDAVGSAGGAGVVVQAGRCTGVVSASESLFIAVRTAGNGVWPGGWLRWHVDDADGSARQGDRELPARQIAPGTVLAPAQPATGHPAATQLQRLAPVIDPPLWAWLCQTLDGPATAADWQRVLTTLEPAAVQRVDHLLAHPHAGRPGHWATQALRDWLDADPLVLDHGTWRQTFLQDGDQQALAERLQPDPAEPWTVQELITLRQAIDSYWRRVWRRLPQPQTAPQQTLPTLAALHAWAQREGLVAEGDLLTWLWRQDCWPEDLLSLGYAADLPGWVQCLRQQLGLRLAVAPSLPIRLGAAGHAFAGGGSFGAEAWLVDDLVLVAAGEHGWSLRPWGRVADASGRHPPVSIRWQALPATVAVQELAEALALRGYGTVRLAAEPDGLRLDAPVDLQLDQVSPRNAVAALARAIGGQARATADGWLILP